MPPAAARHLALALAAACPLHPAQALVPGNVPDEIVGDWQCDETRIYITRLCSIELLGEGYTAGLFRGIDGGIEIE